MAIITISLSSVLKPCKKTRPRLIFHMMLRACFYILTAIIGFACVANAGSQSLQSLSPEAEARLLRGDLVISVWRDKSQSDNAIEVFGAIDIDASAETIWALMLDCNRTMEIVTQMTLCEVLEVAPDGSWDIRRQKIKPGFLLPKSTSVFRSDYDLPYHIKISLLGGDMKVQEGEWILTPIDTVKTRVSYRARLRPKFPIPNGLLKRGIRKDIPRVLKNLRTQSEQAQTKYIEPFGKPR